MKCSHLSVFLLQKECDMARCQITPLRQIDARLVPFQWIWQEAHAQEIEAYWQQILAGNAGVFDGIVLLMHQGHVEGDVYKSSYFQTRYSHFMALRDWGQPDPTVRNGFSCAALQASDGAYVLGVMGARTSNAEKIYFPAGTPDLDDCHGTKVDILGSAARELLEETGFGGAQVTFAERITLVEEDLRVAFLCHADLHLTADEAVAQFTQWHSQQDQPELAGLHIVRSQADLVPEKMHPYLLDWFATVLA